VSLPCTYVDGVPVLFAVHGEADHPGMTEEWLAPLGRRVQHAPPWEGEYPLTGCLLRLSLAKLAEVEHLFPDWARGGP